MPEQDFKRHTAYKFRIGDLLIGKPIINEERFSFLELGDRKIVRVNVVGNIVDKYESEGENKYSSFTLDDGSGQIRLKCFRDDVEKFRDLNQGQTVLVIGLLRYFNNEIYISPEIIKEQDPKYLLVRKIEIEKEREKGKEPAKTMEKEQMTAVKDRILNLIKNSEAQGGTETERIILDLKEIQPNVINQEIQKLLEDGIIFEPRPGKVRWLG